MDRNIRITTDTGQIFEWDERKNEINITKHDLNFLDAKAVFRGPLLEAVDIRVDYGEIRSTALGLLEGRVVYIVFTEPTENVIRLISMRKAQLHEQKEFGEHLKNELGSL